MKDCINSILFLALVNTLLIITLSTAAAELIEPTRNPDDNTEAKGRLTVLSEPPGLKVSLDGNDLGKTPTFLLETKPGFHNLRVGNQETGIYIEPGDTLQMSLFKDEFVEVPVRSKAVDRQLASEQQKASTAPEPVLPSPEEQRAKEEERRAKARFMRFIDGSSPTF